MSVKVRQERIARLMKMLKSSQPIEESKFSSTASYNIGVSVKKIREYLSLLENMEVLENNDGVLVWKE